MVGSSRASSATIPQVKGNLTMFKRIQLPIIEQLTGPNAGTYSNETDTFEANFQSTFFGPNYPRHSSIKTKYGMTPPTFSLLKPASVVKGGTLTVIVW